MSEIELSIVMPCLNEELTVGMCITKAQQSLDENGIIGEVIIADNGSTDRSREIAKELGARVVPVTKKGYGNALKGGFAEAKGKYIIMGDADDSYDFLNLLPFVEKLREGYDLVIGNRFWGGIEPGAMPTLHQYFGNPAISTFGRLIFKTPARDFLCGLRGFTKEAIMRMDMQTNGMEFCTEMVIKASLLDMKVCEIPTTLSPDGRDRAPHLKSWRDGWKNLRFILIFSPRWLFWYPGIALMLLGTILTIWTYFTSINIGDIALDIHSLAYFNAMILIGFNMLLFAVQSRFYAYRTRLIPEKPKFYPLFQYFNLERGILGGILMLLTGLGLTFWAFSIWGNTGFGALEAAKMMRIVLPAVTILLMGTQTVFFSFMVSIIGVKSNFLDNRGDRDDE